jgi:hypothetical protein
MRGGYLCGIDRSAWRTYIGPGGEPYYHNAALNISSWDRPDELVTDSSDSDVAPFTDFDSASESSVTAAELGPDGDQRAVHRKSAEEGPCKDGGPQAAAAAAAPAAAAAATPAVAYSDSAGGEATVVAAGAGAGSIQAGDKARASGDAEVVNNHREASQRHDKNKRMAPSSSLIRDIGEFFDT